MIQLTLFIINTLAFILVGYDKRIAVANKQRIAEKTLLGLVAIGGSLGSGLAMMLFRHKIQKRTYLWKFWSIVIFQILLLCGLNYFDFF